MAFEKSQPSRQLEDRLTQGSPADVLMPADVQAICGLPACGSASPGYKLFMRIAKKVERLTDGDICWRWLKDDQVYRCLANEEKPADVGARTDRIKRAASRNVRIAQTVILDQLPPTMRAAAMTRLVLNGAIAIMSSRKSVNKLLRSTEELRYPEEQDLLEFLKTRK